LRFSSSKSEEPPEEKPTFPIDPDLPLPPLVIDTMRGVGQVVFCGNVPAGVLITAALAVGDPQLAGLALVGCASATAFSRNAASLNIDISQDAVSAGLMGYNGALVGCAFSVFLKAPLAVIGVATVVGGAASALIASKLGPMMAPVPQWTLAFNITALALLALTQPFKPASDDAAPAKPAASAPLDAFDWATAALVGVSQIFVVDSPAAGALMLAGIGSYSPMAAGTTLLGSLIGALTAQVAGGDKESVIHGLCGFNPALASLAVLCSRVHASAHSRTLRFRNANFPTLS
jgi:urea transporter